MTLMPEDLAMRVRARQRCPVETAKRNINSQRKFNNQATLWCNPHRRPLRRTQKRDMDQCPVAMTQRIHGGMRGFALLVGETIPQRISWGFFSPSFPVSSTKQD